MEKRDFIINQVVVGFVFVVIWSLVMACFKKGEFFAFEGFKFNRFLTFFVISVFVFPVGGFFTGLWLWKIMRKKKNY